MTEALSPKHSNKFTLIGKIQINDDDVSLQPVDAQIVLDYLEGHYNDLLSYNKLFKHILNNYEK